MFDLHIETDNAAFDGDPLREVSRILQRVALKLQDLSPMGPGEGINLPVYDTNGNRVGGLRLVREDDDV